MKHMPWIFPILYFGISRFFPWEEVQWDSTISISYLFDIVFVMATTLLYVKNFRFGKIDIKGGFSRLIAVLILSILSISIASLAGIQSPFSLIEHLGLQILILAPFIEELVFRVALFAPFEGYFKNKNYLLLLNAFLFSFSHSDALNYLPEEFHHFIYIQIIYTFFLGWICAKARLKNGNPLESIVLHFSFNFIFYIAIGLGLI